MQKLTKFLYQTFVLVWTGHKRSLVWLKTWWRTKSSLRMSLFLSGCGRRELQWLLGALSSSFAGASVIPVLISAAWWYLTEHSSDKTQGQIRGMSHRCPEDKERRRDVREQKVNRKKMLWHTAFYFQHKIILFFLSLFCNKPSMVMSNSCTDNAANKNQTVQTFANT